MKKLIIGSHALKHFYPDFREPKDLDILTEEPLMSREVQHYWFGDSSAEIMKLNKHDIYIDPDLLLTVKVAHAGWDIHWAKTMTDIVFLKSKGLKVNKDLYKLLVKDFTRIHGAKWAKLEKKGSDKFFTDAVVRKFDHDSIHSTISNYDEPLYFRILKEPGKVGCSEEKFEKLSHEDKILLVEEEVWVTAFERFLVPSSFTHGDRLAYAKSLKKLCTTMSSSWFKFFCLDNYQNLYIPKDYRRYIQKFKAAESKGLIKLNTINKKTNN